MGLLFFEVDNGLFYNESVGSIIFQPNFELKLEPIEKKFKIGFIIDKQFLLFQFFFKLLSIDLDGIFFFWNESYSDGYLT